MKLAVNFLYIIFLLSEFTPTKHKSHKRKTKHAKLKVTTMGSSPTLIRNSNRLMIKNNPGFIVALVRLYEGYHEYICVGTILNYHTIISSNSCASNPEGNEMGNGKVVVRSGTPAIAGTQGFDHRIKNINPISDVAVLIVIKGRFYKENDEDTVPLVASRTFNYSRFLHGKTFGWGDPYYLGAKSTLLKSAELQIVANDVCKNYFKYPFPDESVFCAKRVEGLVCTVDGGEPFLYRNRLIGISLVVNETKCTSSVPVLYAKVSLLEWDLRKMLN